MKDIKVWCNGCDKTWYYRVDDEDFKDGLEKGIYYGTDKNGWNAESCCDKCLAEIKSRNTIYGYGVEE